MDRINVYIGETQMGSLPMPHPTLLAKSWIEMCPLDPLPQFLSDPVPAEVSLRILRFETGYERRGKDELRALRLVSGEAADLELLPGWRAA